MLYKLTKSASEIERTIGRPLVSVTLVPTGAFSSAKPSTDEALITGGLLSTGFTVILNFAVADRSASESSTAFKQDKVI